LRISIDAKATVWVGAFSRSGQSRVVVKAMDHDFRPEDKVTPFGIYLPQQGELFLYMTTSLLTSDYIVDCLEDFWSTLHQRFPLVKTLLINLDNGPENHSRRTQFMARLTHFSDQHHLTIQLAYYPPYHSKYNPIERVWGGLEQHWNGALLDSVDTVFNFAQTLTWRTHHPVVKLLTKIYHKGVRLSQSAMLQLEKRLHRLDGLKKWFVSIYPLPSPGDFFL
jgi:transposase